MILIKLTTEIKAPIERCFDLSTSIDLHIMSTSSTQEQAIAGKTSGLIQLDETVTWKAKHFGFWHQMTVKITEFERPNYFVDKMIKGTFKSMQHRHEFKSIESGTLMIDEFLFESPMGILGQLVDNLVLKKYLTAFLKERNEVIREYAESDEWKEVLRTPKFLS